MGKINKFFIWLLFEEDGIKAPIDIVKVIIAIFIFTWGLLLMLTILVGVPLSIILPMIFGSLRR